MNRTLKFKALDGKGYVSSPFTLQDLQDGKIQFASDCKVVQFTGLTDCNSAEIYEGDECMKMIYKTKLMGTIVVGKVVYAESLGAFLFFWKDTTGKRPVNRYDDLRASFGSGDTYRCDSIEIKQQSPLEGETHHE